MYVYKIQLSFGNKSVCFIYRFLANRSVIMLESQIHVRLGDMPLYPSEYESFVIVVPNLLHSNSSFFHTLLNIPLVNIWLLAISIFSVGRKALRTLNGSRSNGFIEIVFNTFGMSFGATSQTPRRGSAGDNNRPERVLVLFLSVFAMLASILCSGMLFQEFTNTVTMSSINSLEDLGKHQELEIWMLSDLHISTEQWLNEQ